MRGNEWKAVLLAGVAIGTLGGVAHAQAIGDTEGDKEPVRVATLSPAIENIIVTGSVEKAREVGGAATFLSETTLEEMSYSDITRVMRLVPGVNIQEEDGFGLRPNIGIRGTGLDRSAKIALYEDGVLIAPAPYAAPSAYYFPSAGRMESMEIVKGPAGIKYGPLTTGGAVNLFSTSIPSDEEYSLDASFGSDGHRSLHAIVGKTFDGGIGPKVGLLGEYFNNYSDGFKELDGGGDTGFDIDDFVGKFSFETGANVAIKQTLEVKAQYSDEISDETYLGLTAADYSQNPYRRYRGSALDKMDSEHTGFQVSYGAELTEDRKLSIVAYRNEFQRNWFKLDRVLGTKIASVLSDPVTSFAEYDAVVGAAGYVSPDDALSIKNNNRVYLSKGIQAHLTQDFTLGEVAHSLEVSVRYHEDEMDRFQWIDGFRMDNGTLVQTAWGTPGTDSNRIETASAVSFFVLDEINWGALTLTPGVRFESIELKRRDFGKTDPARTGAALVVKENDVDVTIPGLGVTYGVSDSISLLAGVHKGFTPPGAGSSADAEESVNYEAGVRYFSGSASFEVIGFFSDYSNLVGTCTASTGSGCAIGDQFDGGEVDVAGVEVMALADLGDTLGLGLSVPIRLVYTLTQAEFQTDFNSAYGPWGTVVSGDEMPLIPEHQFNLGVGIEDERWSVHANISYVDDVRATAGQGSIASDDLIEDRVVVDLSADYAINDNFAVYAVAENVFDETYLVARTPAGLRPGKPQSFRVGVKATF